MSFRSKLQSEHLTKVCVVEILILLCPHTLKSSLVQSCFVWRPAFTNAVCLSCPCGQGIHTTIIIGGQILQSEEHTERWGAPLVGESHTDR